MKDATQEQEMKLAYDQKRQPNCVYCLHPLEKVVEYQDEKIVWTYSKELKAYEKKNEGVGEKPYHDCSVCEDGCAVADWAFIDYKLIDF